MTYVQKMSVLKCPQTLDNTGFMVFLMTIFKTSGTMLNSLKDGKQKKIMQGFECIKTKKIMMTYEIL